MADFPLTQNQLSQIINNPHIPEWYEVMAQCLPDYEINTPVRIAQFLAQTGTESGDYRQLKENLNYRAESLMKIWPARFPSLEIANQYAHNQVKIANKVYGGRMGNGPEATGEGYKYCGRGLIQITGKNNYQAFADSLQMHVEDVPDYLSTFEGAVQSACWYWESRNINNPADREDTLQVTKLINGGTIGLEERIKRYQKARSILVGA